MPEVAFYTDESQFQSGHSVMKCGFYACCQNHFAGQHQAEGTGADIMRQADLLYQQYDGADLASNANGMSMQQLYSCLQQLGNHWQNLYPDSLPTIGQPELRQLIREWVGHGYPVICAVDEASVRDMDLGDGTPYSWNPQPGQYSHIITVSGLHENGVDYLCRDTASIGASGVRQGPRRYESTYLQIISATVFVPAWMPRPASTTPGQPAPAPEPTPAPVSTPTPAPVDYKQEVKDLVQKLVEAVTHL